MEKIIAVILAAGKGTRMGDVNGSPIPKVMFPLSGKPLIDYSVSNVKNAGVLNVVLVVGYKKEMIEEYFHDQVSYAVQEEQLGTGHAVMMAEELIKNKSEAVLVCYGDMPLFKPKTIRKLVELYFEQQPTVAMLSVKLSDPNSWAYGRIVRDPNDEVIGIVEQKDCSEDEREIDECNPGFYIFDSNWLWENCKKLSSVNSQNEYYLTDLIALAKAQDKRIMAVPVSEESEALGINTPEQLQQAEALV